MMNDGSGGDCRVARKEMREDGTDSENWVPLSVREARQARKMREDLLPYVRMNFVSSTLLAAALGIMAYRMGVQCCH
jgi:hypothetical protein